MAGQVASQMTLFTLPSQTLESVDTTSTFSDNLRLPIHNWFRYSAGFSAPWVRQLIAEEKAKGERRIFDPFAGSGTVLLESEVCNTSSQGIEAHPFVARVARAKLNWRESPPTFREYGLSLLERARKIQIDHKEYPSLLNKCFPPAVLSRLQSLLEAWEMQADGSNLSELAWLALASIVRECSPVGTAQWQYVLPNKTKAKPADPYQAFQTRILQISNDMAMRQTIPFGPEATLHRDDARLCSLIPDRWANLVITSPPYANNYDYADAMRLEMTFFGEVREWGDLQGAVRAYLIRSCTQHVAPLTDKTGNMLEEALLEPIRREIKRKCEILEAERGMHGGRKPYHTMIAAYFIDMARCWKALRRVTTNDALVCWVIGNSAPYGILIPVEEWSGMLAVAAGFRSYHFEKIRNRNIKWKNRKHRVPLHEGRLWVQG